MRQPETVPPTPAAAPAPTQPSLARLSERAGSLWTLGVLVLIVVVFCITTPNFLSKATWLATSVAAVEILLLALGQTFVIISRGIDLSVGSVLGVSGMVSAYLMQDLLASGTGDTAVIVIGLLVCLGVGGGLGMVNGLVITRLGISPFVATLGMLGIAAGGAQLVNDGQEVSGLPVALSSDIGNKVLFDNWVPVPVLVAAVLAVLAALVLHRTRFGRRTFAIGSNEEAALRTGINVKRHLLLIYIISGLFAGMAGFLVTAQLSVASVNAGQNDELASIAAVVIGGASLFGGRGAIAGAVVGTMIVVVLETGLVVAKVEPAWQVIAIGVILIAAVWADQGRLKLALRG